MKNDPRSYDRNFCNCVKKPEKKTLTILRGRRVHFNLSRPINTTFQYTAKILTESLVHSFGSCWQYFLIIVPRDKRVVLGRLLFCSSRS